MIKPVRSTKAMTTGKQAILKTLLYFDIFSYPLTNDEIFRSCNYKWENQDDFKTSLAELVSSDYIRTKSSFYYLGREEKVSQRTRGNKLAKEFMKKAVQNGRLISKFPFVRGVMISGSLSKGYMQEDSDVDYFIITKPERLWVARTLLILYKKLFLLNSHKYFCVNYFVDTNHLEIEDKNRFTATEVAYLIPIANYPVWEEFIDRNNWIFQHFPNFSIPEPETEDQNQPSKFEGIFNGRLGARFDHWCMKRTLSRWQKKFPDKHPERFEVAMRTRKYVSKHHPSDFQLKVMNAWRDKITAFEKEKKIDLGGVHG